VNKWFWLKFVQFSLALFIVIFSSSAFTQTLKEAIIQTVHTNPDILVNIKNWLASEQAIKVARGGYLPTVDLIAEYGHEHSKSQSTAYNGVNLTFDGFGVTLRQMLFDGFSASSEVARNKNRTIADIYQTQGIADDVALLAVKAYLDVLRMQKIVFLAEKNYKAHQDIYAMIKSRARAGVGREADISQAYGRLALAKANLLATQSTYSDMKTVYNKIIGGMPKNLVMPQGPKASDLPLNESRAIQEALEHHPTLKAAGADIEEARAQHDVAVSANYPRIDAVVSASRYHDADGMVGLDENYIAMLQLRYNLFRGGSDRAKQQETAIIIDKAQEIRHRTHTQVVESMKLSWNAWQNARKQLIYFKKHREASRVTVDSYRKQFTIGKRTLLDVLDSENELFTAETDYVDGLFNVLFSKFRVLNSKGMLLPYMKVDLPSPTEKLEMEQMYWASQAPVMNSQKSIQIAKTLPVIRKNTTVAEISSVPRQQKVARTTVAPKQTKIAKMPVVSSRQTEVAQSAKPVKADETVSIAASKVKESVKVAKTDEKLVEKKEVTVKDSLPKATDLPEQNNSVLSTIKRDWHEVVSLWMHKKHAVL
jgi:adhesin transport system outer membrane protein